MRDLNGFVGDRLYLDANVFIYAVEGFAPYDVRLRGLFSMIEERAVRAVTSEVTLMETLVRPLRENRRDLVAIYEALLSPESAVDVVSVSRAVLQGAAAIRGASGAKPIDAVHIATALESRCDAFLSEDRKLDPSPVRKMMLDELIDG